MINDVSCRATPHVFDDRRVRCPANEWLICDLAIRCGATVRVAGVRVVRRLHDRPCHTRRGSHYRRPAHMLKNCLRTSLQHECCAPTLSQQWVRCTPRTAMPTADGVPPASAETLTTGSLPLNFEPRQGRARLTASGQLRWSTAGGTTLDGAPIPTGRHCSFRDWKLGPRHRA
jgi:hypothetical protein